jgi:hypothetical protein
VSGFDAQVPQAPAVAASRAIHRMMAITADLVERSRVWAQDGKQTPYSLTAGKTPEQRHVRWKDLA